MTQFFIYGNMYIIPINYNIYILKSQIRKKTFVRADFPNFGSGIMVIYEVRWKAEIFSSATMGR